MGSSGYNEITYRYRVACMISLLVLACMCVFGFFVVIGMGLSRCENDFQPCLAISG